MLKKLIAHTLATTTFILATSNIYAMQLNVNVGSDIKKNHDEILFVYDLYYKANNQIKESHFKFSGMTGVMFQQFINILNHDVLASIDPIDSSSGKHSQFSFGYVKNGVSISPSSCQNIFAQSVTNVSFNENGCAVL